LGDVAQLPVSVFCDRCKRQNVVPVPA
jgi:hypothetical protein